jgi:tetratricopeptide (TPR) repeat protein
MKSIAKPAGQAATSGDPRLGQARDLVEKKRFAEAMEIFDAILKDNPDAVGAYIGKASVYLRQDNLDEAENHLNGAAYLNSKIPAVRLMLARVAERRGDFERCLKESEEALKIRPQLNTARLGMARAYMRLKRYSEAEHVLREALRFNPQFTEATLMLGRVLQRKGQGAEAVAFLDAAVERNPESSQVHALKALILLGSQDYPGAIAAGQAGIKCEPNNANAQAVLGRAYCANNQYDQGIAAIEKAVVLDPALFPAKMQLVEAYEQSGRVAEATRLLRGMSSGPHRALVHIRLGHLFVAQESFEQAISEYEAALLNAVGMAEKHPQLAAISKRSDSPREKALAYQDALEKARQRDRLDSSDDELLAANGFGIDDGT